MDINIEETFLNQITIRELKAAHYFDTLSATEDVLTDIVQTDYYKGEHPLAGKSDLDANTLIPTGIIYDKYRCL